MIVDGKQIAEAVYEEIRTAVAKFSRAPRLTIITCHPNFETKKYLALKEKKALSVGIETNLVELEDTATTEDFVLKIQESILHSDGIIVQLPLPPYVDRDTVVASVPTSHDVDALNPATTTMCSPVVGAIKRILEQHNVAVSGKNVTIIGSGKLVGLPAYQWFVKMGAHVSLVTRDTADIQEHTRIADIVVCGAGVPGLLTPEMVREGVVILDAGTTEDGGELRGDAIPACADSASVFTPVPGGIGPITIAVLLSNVVDCAERAQSVV